MPRKPGSRRHGGGGVPSPHGLSSRAVPAGRGSERSSPVPGPAWADHEDRAMACLCSSRSRGLVLGQAHRSTCYGLRLLSG